MGYTGISNGSNLPPTDRQLAAVRKLGHLNNGWPYSDGPERWAVRGEARDGQVHLVCAACDQSVFPLALALDEPGYEVSGEILKARIADHCLKSHRNELGDLILT